jgi:hypothetical protein
MNRNRQENDPIRNREPKHAPGDRDRSGEHMRNREASDLERRQVEGDLGNERTRTDRDDNDADRDF